MAKKSNIAGLTFEVREIPGHSPGSVVFVCDQFDPNLVFGGDVLFAGSIGRTDLGGDMPQLLAGSGPSCFRCRMTPGLPGPRARHIRGRGETLEPVRGRVGNLLPSALNERLGDL